MDVQAIKRTFGIIGTELDFVNHHASLRVIGQHSVADLHEYNMAQIKKTINL